MYKSTTRLAVHQIRRRLYSTVKPPIVKIEKGTFYRHHPSSLVAKQANPPLFPDLDFQLNHTASETKTKLWAIIGPSSSGKTSLLQVIRGQYLADPPLSRTYPYLSSDAISEDHSELRIPSKAIQYVGFGEESGSLQVPGTKSAYLSARYESLREETDWTLRNFLEGKTELNPSAEEQEKHVDPVVLERVMKDLRLGELMDMPVANLSNGQTRRAMIAKALLQKPLVLLLDEVFMGLDPPTQASLSPLLLEMAAKGEPGIVLSLRSQDPIPDWITHVAEIRPGCRVGYIGDKDGFLEHLEGDRSKSTPARGDEVDEVLCTSSNEKLVEMNGVKVAYGPKVVLGNWSSSVNGETTPGLHWTVRRGERWGVLGANGSGKTTLLSLICSDHPQTYSQPVKLFGRSRIPERGQPGISIFDLQAKIGHSSPEIHHHIPRSMTLRGTLENAWAETFLLRPQLDEEAKTLVRRALLWFQDELDLHGVAGSSGDAYANDVLFRELPFSAQRVALFLRAIIKSPDLVILDEAFSGMDEYVRDKCLLYLAHGEGRRLAKGGKVEGTGLKEDEHAFRGLNAQQALICIGHVKEEIPASVRDWICLPEASTGQPARFGRLGKPLYNDVDTWKKIWGCISIEA